MPIFPAGVTLIAAPSQIYSLGASAIATIPILSSEYPLTNLTDGSAKQPTRFAWGTGQITIDLGTTRTPKIFGVLNHNFDPGLILGVTNEAGLNRGFSVRDPNCWIDLRGFPTTAQNWTLTFNGNSHTVSIGEIVVADAYSFDGVVEPNFAEQIVYPGSRQKMEYAQIHQSASGAMVRSVSLALQITQAEAANLALVFAGATAGTGRVLVVPTTRYNDLWLAEWPATSEFTYPQSVRIQTIPLQLMEETGGVLNGR